VDSPVSSIVSMLGNMLDPVCDLVLDPVSILLSNCFRCYRFGAIVGLIIPLLFVNPALSILHKVL